MLERRENAKERWDHLEDESELGPAQLPVVPSGSALFDDCLDEKEERVSLVFLVLCFYCFGVFMSKD